MSHKLVFLKCFSKNKLWKEWCDKAWIQTKAEFLAGGTNTASGSSSYQNKTTTDPVRTPDCSASKHHKNIFLQIFRECKIILFLAWIFYRQNRRISLTCRIRSGFDNFTTFRILELFHLDWDPMQCCAAQATRCQLFFAGVE